MRQRCLWNATGRFPPIVADNRDPLPPLLFPVRWIEDSVKHQTTRPHPLHSHSPSSSWNCSQTNTVSWDEINHVGLTLSGFVIELRSQVLYDICSSTVRLRHIQIALFTANSRKTSRCSVCIPGTQLQPINPLMWETRSHFYHFWLNKSLNQEISEQNSWWFIFSLLTDHLIN